jgi:hypothetical protein
LTSKTSRRSQPGSPVWTTDGGISPVELELARVNDGGRVASAFPGDGVGGCGHAVGVDLEEETEAQEGQGVLVPQGARTSQTIRADNASKVPVSYEPRRLPSNGEPVRIREVERQGGQGSG